MKKLSAILGWLLMANWVFGQILAPDFQCVRGDTLRWLPASNSCGVFISYDVYFSANYAGPFTFLGQVTDPMQTYFYHANPGGNRWFYYLESNHNCPGFPREQSDTLDNKAPETPVFQYVSVENGKARIAWYPYQSPDIIATIIYRNSSIPLDTVFNSNDYLDLTSDPDTKSESYVVVSMDRCGNTSLFSVSQSTLFLETNASSCEQTISLRWNDYQNWQNGVAKYEIWVAVGGAAPVLIDTVSGATNSFVFKNADDGVSYCFTVRAVEQLTGNASTSNEVCLTPDLVQPMRNIAIKNISATPSGELEVTWIWDANAELKSAALLGNKAGDDVILPVNLPVSPLQQENKLLFSGANPVQHQWLFQIMTTDQCDTVQKSDIGASIFLVGRPQTDKSKLLQWTPLVIPNVAVQQYLIYKIINGQAVQIGAVGGGVTEFVFPFNPAEPIDEISCFYVAARSIFAARDGSTESVISNSNQVCISLAVEVYFPNAFAPRGRNQIFKPVTAITNFSDYKMLIFNRWGEAVFETTDFEKGWNGKIDGQEAPPGLYAYMMKLRQTNGTLIEKKGTVLLVR